MDLCLIAYLVATIHEMGHLCVAKFLGYKISEIKISLCGACLKLQDDVLDCRHEFIISVAGPLVNVVLIIIGIALSYIKIKIPQIFYISNFYMIFVNLLPVMPLDGGRIFNAILKSEIGDKKAKKLSALISIPVICAIAVSGVILFFKSKLNVSLLIVSFFLCNNIKPHKKTNDITCLYSSEFTCDTAKIFYINENISIKAAIKNLPFKEICIVAILSDNGRINKLITNKYILSISETKCLNDKINTVFGGENE